MELLESHERVGINGRYGLRSEAIALLVVGELRRPSSCDQSVRARRQAIEHGRSILATFSARVYLGRVSCESRPTHAGDRRARSPEPGTDAWHCLRA